MPVLGNNQKTAKEMSEWYSQNKPDMNNYAKAMESLKLLRNVSKNKNSTITAFNKETLRGYLQNIGASEKQLRNLSRYLYFRSQPYHRLIQYNATMFDLNARSVIPDYNPTKTINERKLMKNYFDTLTILDGMNLQFEMTKAYKVAFREDVFYGCVYSDDTGFFILPVDPDYCKISGIYSKNGDFSYSVDMTYFARNQDYLELWGEPFQSMYNAYLRDTVNGKWQPIPDENCICFKVDAENWQTVVPPFSGMFNSVINTIDVEDVQAIAEKQDIYKMLWLELETMGNSKNINDWKIDPDVVAEYFTDFIDDCVPGDVTAAIIPGKLNAITFGDSGRLNDTNKISKATKALFNSAGGSQILNSEDVSGTEAFRAVIKADTQLAISSLLPQTQAWLNRFLSYKIANPARVKFMEISVYTRDWMRDALTTQAEYGMPVKLLLNTLNGFSEKDTIALNYLEENILKLSDKFVPLQSAHTTSNVKDDDSKEDNKETKPLTTPKNSKGKTAQNGDDNE